MFQNMHNDLGLDKILTYILKHAMYYTYTTIIFQSG